MGKATGPAREEKTMKRWASLLLTTAVSSCESACCRWVFVWQKLCTQDLYGSTISSFTGNHSVWLNSYCYRFISLDAQELYHLVSLIGVGTGQASFIFGQSLMEVIDLYHLGKARYIFGSHWNHWMNIIIVRWLKLLTTIIVQETRLIFENIQQHCLDKLYRVILIDEYHCLDEQCSWMFLSRVNISSVWTNIMLDQVIIALISSVLRRSLK